MHFAVSPPITHLACIDFTTYATPITPPIAVTFFDPLYSMHYAVYSLKLCHVIISYSLSLILQE